VTNRHHTGNLNSKPFRPLSAGGGRRVYFVNCRRDGVDETLLLKRLMSISAGPPCVAVATPAEADLILIAGILEHNTFENLRANEIWRRFPEKSFGYAETDNVPSFLHGVYASATCGKGLFNRLQSSGYPGHRAWRPNALPSTAPFYRSPKTYLFSFIGRRSHPVRKKLFHTLWPGYDVLIMDQTGKYDHFQAADFHREKQQAEYWDVMRRSKFVLCPRGAGASSIRLFEAMQAGVAPVIISDGWRPAFGPDWREFAIFIPERNVARTYEILKGHEDEFAERGRQAAAAYEKWFSDAAAWGQLLAAIQAIQRGQKIPERWFVRMAGIIYFLELMHEWRYRLPIGIKTRLRQVLALVNPAGKSKENP
jgi:hypothetical protein